MKKENEMKKILLFGITAAQLLEQTIKTCGMFKLYKNRYLSGVKKFETVTVSGLSRKRL